MDNKILKYLYDALEAANNIKQFTKGKGFNDYDSNDIISSAVERQFEIMGEALNRIKKIDSKFETSINGFREAISFRNILAHGYDTIDNILVWGIIKNDLPNLISSIEKLMK